MSRRKRWVAATVAAVLAFGSWLARPDADEDSSRHDIAVKPTPELVARGEYLARAGNCIGCHTAPGGVPYAGGRRIPTPFGDVFSTNLTPDPETGLGAWSSDDFWRAMHHGESRDGRLLYPAFPYTSYTRVTRADVDAIFAFLRSLPPVKSPRIEPEVRFPFNTQLALMAWRALYFRPGVHEDDPGRSPAWNRGAYLVEGLGHCGECHRRRTWLGGTDPDEHHAGGAIPMLGWDAPPLAPARPMSDAEAEEMAELLRAGTSARGVVTGPMAEVVFQSLQYLDEADIDAMVAYIRTLPGGEPAGGGAPAGGPQAERLARLGERVYRDRCAECHGDDGEGEAYVYPALAGNPSVTAPSANNALQTVLFGGYPPSTAANPMPYGMPPYAHELSAEEIAGVLTYIRRAWGNDASAVSPGAVERR
ncbi:MAG TPA: cytochrome c [Gammaproteobacteria bacterium]